MGLWIDVGIDAQADRRLFADAGGDFVQRKQLFLRFDVEHQYAGMESVFDFLLFLADPRKDNFFRVGADFQRAEKLAARHDVKAAAFLREAAQQREVGIGLHRKTDDMASLGEGLIENLEMALERRETIDIRRRANSLRDALERHALGEHFPVAIFKMVHRSPRATSTSLDGALKEPSNNCDETRYR